MTDDDLGFDPSHFDPGHAELSRRLGSAAPPGGDADAVLAGLRPRLTRARHRRRAGMLAVVTAAVFLMAGVAFAATDPGDSSKVRVPPATRPPVTADTNPTPTTPTMPIAPTTTPEGRATTPTTPTTSLATPATGATAPTTAAGTPPTTVDDHGGNRGPGGTSPNSGPGSGSSGSSGSGSSSSGKG